MNKKIVNKILTSSLVDIENLSPETRALYENVIFNTVGRCISTIDDGDGSMSSRDENSWLAVCRKDIAAEFDILLDNDFHLIK